MRPNSLRGHRHSRGMAILGTDWTASIWHIRRSLSLASVVPASLARCIWQASGGIAVAAVGLSLAMSPAAAQFNLAGGNSTATFGVSGPDPFAPYTNTGGANAPATLTLNAA